MPDEQDSPATLMAILVAAKKAGDRELLREMRRRLEERYGVRVTFAAKHSARQVRRATT